MWNAIASIAAAAAAAFAGLQLWLSRRDANSRAVFEHLREIDRRVQDAWSTPTTSAQKELLEYYRGSRSDLTPGARHYLSLLNSLDVLSFAVHKSLVDGNLVAEYLDTLLTEDVISRSFIREMQTCCGDDNVYKHLADYLAQHRWSRKRPALPSNS